MTTHAKHRSTTSAEPAVTYWAPQPVIERPAWKALEAHHAKIREVHLRRLLAEDPGRGERLTAEAVGVFLDYSKNRITDETLTLLLQLAEQSGLRARIDAMFCGDKINVSEKRAVLHVALRAPRGAKIVVDGEDVVSQVHAVLDRMSEFAERVRDGTWKRHTGKRIRNVVNIGIGGSDLGPVMAYEALRHYSERAMTFRFVSNVDGTDFAEAVRDLDPAETMFIVSSKTFTTLETMTNARTARAWSIAGLGGDERSHSSLPATPGGSAMTVGFDRDLYVLPFDHRGSFETKMFGWEGPLSAEQTAQIAAAKQVIYDGFKDAVAAGVRHFSARQGVEDDHMNILCMGGRTVGPAVAWDLIQTFLAAEGSRAERHLRRLGKVASLEEGR